MPKYIDATKLSRGLAGAALRLNCNENMERIVNIICKMVMDEPEADVVEVVHGYWIGEYPKVPKCSVCSAIDGMKGDYCRYCGAKMDRKRR